MAFLLLTLTRWMGGQGAECGIKKWTGCYCPGCGGTRCATALIHGKLLHAFSLNALLTSGVILFSAGCLYLIIRISILNQPPPTLRISSRWIWVILTIITLFTILRNTTTFGFLAP
jgi:hypothetical protein